MHAGQCGIRLELRTEELIVGVMGDFREQSLEEANAPLEGCSLLNRFPLIAAYHSSNVRRPDHNK
jgi:hypothetical protein